MAFKAAALVSENYDRPLSRFVSKLILGLLTETDGGGVRWVPRGKKAQEGKLDHDLLRHHKNILLIVGSCSAGRSREQAV